MAYFCVIIKKLLYVSCGSSWELSNAKRCLASPRQGSADPCKTKLQYTPVAKIKNILLIPSAHLLYSRPLTLSRRRRPRLLRKSVNSHFFQRACRQCVHESARLFRVICSHAWYGGDCGERQNCQLVFYPLSRSLATHGSHD